MDDVKIVGIAGYPRSGKDSLGEAFISAGYFGVSLGDIVRDYSRKRHADKDDAISVKNMTETSNWLRETNGPDVLLKEALRRFQDELKAGKDHKGMLFISVRAPVEADFIRSKGGELLWVEATAEVRHKRNNAHLREGEQSITLEEFIANEQLQATPQPNIPIVSQMNLEYVKSKATRIVNNNDDDFEEFKLTAKKIVQSLG